MSKVPNRYLIRSAPRSLSAAWNTIERKAFVSYQKFILPRMAKMASPINLELLAAKCGYVPAVKRALSFSGSPFAKMNSNTRSIKFVNPVIYKVLIPFLTKRHFDTRHCLAAISDILTQTLTRSIPNFSYGNAQKWVNMTIKYYLILLAYTPTLKGPNNCGIPCPQKNILEKLYQRTNFYGYSLMPIDTHMCGHITVDFGTVSPFFTPYPWSRNNKSKEFIDYWQFINSSLSSSQVWGKFIPLLYEIYVW